MLNVITGVLDIPTPPVTNSYESIATVNVTSNQSTISFSSIPSTYSHLQVRVLAKTDGGIGWVSGVINSDTASNYRYHDLRGDGSSATAASGNASSCLLGLTSSGATSPVAMVIDYLDYTSTVKNKTIRTLSGSDSNGSGYMQLTSNLYFATPAAINALSFTCGGNFNAGTVFALYGIKG